MVGDSPADGGWWWWLCRLLGSGLRGGSFSFEHQCRQDMEGVLAIGLGN